MATFDCGRVDILVCVSICIFTFIYIYICIYIHKLISMCIYIYIRISYLKKNNCMSFSALIFAGCPTWAPWNSGTIILFERFPDWSMIEWCLCDSWITPVILVVTLWYTLVNVYIAIENAEIVDSSIQNGDFQ